MVRVSRWYSESLQAERSGHRIWLGADFVHPSRADLPNFYSMGTGFFLGVFWPGHSVNHPHPRHAEFEFCTFTVPLVHAWTLLTWTLHLPFTLKHCIQHCIKCCDVCPDCTVKVNFCYLLLTILYIFSLRNQFCLIEGLRPTPEKKNMKKQKAKKPKVIIFACIVIIMQLVRL